MPVGGLRSILGTLHLIALYLVATVLQGVCVCVVVVRGYVHGA